MNRYFGKYRGTVVENLDPLMLGRVQVDVPSLPGSMFNWAMPCVPYAGEQVGFYMIPPVGAGVWVEFEGGDPDYPIWAGCFWRQGELPARGDPEHRLIRTNSAQLVLDDTPGEGGFTLTVCEPAVATPITISGSSAGVTIAMGEVRLAMTDSGIDITGGAAALSLRAEGATLHHGSAKLVMSEPTVEVNGMLAVNGEPIEPGT